VTHAAPHATRTPGRPPAPRDRVWCACLLAATIALGLATRRFPSVFPSLLATYGGDALWAAMVYWLLAFLRPSASWRALAAGALGIAIAVECSQLVHTPWLDAVRATRLGALVLGQGFLWSDLVAYLAGVGLAVLMDRVMRRSGPTR
jgi:hypothetical protein